MKIETQTKITINLDGAEYALNRSEAEDLYYKLKKELGITDTQIWPSIPQNPLPQYPRIWCGTNPTI